MSHRIEKVNELLREEVAGLLKELVASRDFFITITRVDTARNLASAKVYFLVYPDSLESNASVLLRDRVVRIQQSLNKRLRMHHVPKIIFIPDISEKKAAEIEMLLSD